MENQPERISDDELRVRAEEKAAEAEARRQAAEAA